MFIPEIESASFWQDAFEEGAPFVDLYRTQFRDGLRLGDPKVLSFHHEAIWSLRREAIPPVTSALILIGALYPCSDFIESLAFALEQEKYSGATKVWLKARPSLAKEVADACRQIAKYLELEELNDIVAKSFRSFSDEVTQELQ